MSWYSSPFVRICSFLAKEKQRLRWPSNISQLLVQCTELRLRPNLEFCRVNDVAYISGPCRCWHFCLCWWLCVNNHLKICDYNKKEQQKNARSVFFPGFFSTAFCCDQFHFQGRTYLSHKLFLHIHSGSAMSLLEFCVCEDCMWYCVERTIVIFSHW